jgi:glycosyl transferase family 2
MHRRTIEKSEIVQAERLPLLSCSAIIAIPARNEAERIARCLAALAVQRDRLGAPIPPGRFGVLLLVNNATDCTAEVARRLMPDLPYPLEVLEVSLVGNATAGGARRRAMQEAAEQFGENSANGVLLTTDADSLVAPTWFSDNLFQLNAGADCVAGYIDAEPAEIVSHGALFLARGRLEDTYLRLVAEIYARCDPRPHDPWPNHRVSSGASLAVKLAAYVAVGGMPDKALGEDAAFTTLLDEKGFKVRHPLDVSVLTSCRLDGRATGGAADTMRYRRDTPDAPCDDDLEPATKTLLRASLRGFLRKAYQEDDVEAGVSRLLKRDRLDSIASLPFFKVWQEIEVRHPNLQRRSPLRPSELPRQIAAAKFILRHLRLSSRRTGVPADKYPHAIPHALVDA